MKHKNEKGFTLILSLVLLLVMSLMGGGLVVVSSSDHQSNNSSDEYQQAFYIAEHALLEAEAERLLVLESLLLPLHPRRLVGADEGHALLLELALLGEFLLVLLRLGGGELHLESLHLRGLGLERESRVFGELESRSFRSRRRLRRRGGVRIAGRAHGRAELG